MKYSMPSPTGWEISKALIAPAGTPGEVVTIIGPATFSSCRKLTAVRFLGDAAKAARTVFSRGATPTIYRKPEAKGWGETWGGMPVKLISEKP